MIFFLDFSLSLGDFQELLILFLSFQENKRQFLSRKVILFHLFGCTKYGDTRGLDSVQFLAALNICFGRNRTLSKDVMSKSFHNLSMQALSLTGNSIMLKFDAIKKLNKNLQKKGSFFILV